MVGCRTALALLLLASATAVASAQGAPATGPGFSPAQVAEGARLAAIGNCRTCHTAPGGRSYAGGRALSTPFGTMYSTNITPDAQTGIGDWSAAEFARAMREGVDRDGRHLYPAFPYDHFTLLAEEDVAALYAFVITRAPVSARAPRNRLLFPANLRPLLGIWKVFYFRPRRFASDPQRNAQWNRGAYLVEGLAHCGACHTPRNFAGAEKPHAPLGGGDAEGWHAPALVAASPPPVPWTVDAMVAYLRQGFDGRHGIAAGPMAPIVDTLATVPEADVRAIATYLIDRGAPAAVDPALIDAANDREFDPLARLAPGRGPGSSPAVAATDVAGDVIFAGACAICHYAGDALPARKPAPLALATSVNAPDPRNALRIVRDGLHPESGESGAIMPGFAGALTEAQIVAVVQYMRARFSDRPRWTNVDEALRKIDRDDAP